MGRFFAIDGPKAHVFKAMYNQLKPPWTLGYLRSRTDIGVIHLRRRNLLKQYVSCQLLGRLRQEPR
jgi:hypothetical protein